MRITLAAGIFSLAVFAAACGGGGGTGAGPLPNTPPGGPATPAHAGSRQMSMVLNIPPASQQSHAHKPFFVSPNTKSLAVAVVPNGTTPAPANLQVFPVTTPSPCATTAAGGETCSFTVTAPFGTDQFYVATFNVPSPNPSTTSLPLAVFVSGAIVVASPVPGVTSTPLAFTLNGIVNSVTVTVPSPDPSNTPNTQVFTVGIAQSPLPLGITAYDASGAPILTDGFAAPIALTLTPGGSGVTLAINGTCPGSTGGGAAVTIGCAANLGNVTFAYDGSVTPDASDHIVDTFTISAAQNASPAPSPANVVLQSNVQTYTPSPGAYTFAIALLQTLPNNVIGYVLTGSSSVVGAYGTLNIATGVSSAPVILNATNPNGFYEMSSDGSIWVSDGTNTQLECFHSTGGNAVTTIPLTSTLSYVDNVMFDGTNLWWTGYFYNNPNYTNYAYYAPVTSTCTIGAATGIALPNDIYGDGRLHMAPLVGGGVAIDGQNDGGFWTVTTAGATNYSPGFAAGTGFGGGVAVDGAGTIFAAFNNDCGASCAESSIMKLSGGALTLVDTVPSIQFGALAAFGPTVGGPADRLAFADTTDGALGLMSGPNTATPAALLVGMPSAYFSDNGQTVAISTKGASFISYQNQLTNAMTIGRALLTTTWSIPVTNLPTSDMLSIDERIDSSPFTITPVGTPPTCYTGVTPLAYSNHDFLIGTIYQTGTCTLTITVTDKNKRSQTVTINAPENAG